MDLHPDIPSAAAYVRQVYELGVRKNVLLTSKSVGRTAKDAEKDLETTLRLLKTDHVERAPRWNTGRRRHRRALRGSRCRGRGIPRPRNAWSISEGLRLGTNERESHEADRGSARIPAPERSAAPRTAGRRFGDGHCVRRAGRRRHAERGTDLPSGAAPRTSPGP